MIILGIETSCDDTAVAVIEARGRKRPQFEILANVVSSQTELHRKWGGVYPTLAKREHQKNLVPVLREALTKAKLLKKSQSSKRKAQNHSAKLKSLKNTLKREKDLFKNLNDFLGHYQKPALDLIAVTVGPGLEPCLWQGVNFAKALSSVWNLPIIPVNHLEAHVLANVLSQISEQSKIRISKSKRNPKEPSGESSPVKIQTSKPIQFPAVCLIVSGGHTQLILMRNFGQYKILGETRDDAAGECFDKTARLLGLGYPGGPAIAATAKNKADRDPVSVKLPRPMMHSQDYDFSFSGLKTAVLYDYQKRAAKVRKSKTYLQAMAKEIQQAIVEVLIKKTIRAAKEYKARTIILGGGVAANQELRRQLKRKIQRASPGLRCLAPQPWLCTDNAVMIAVAGYYGWLKKKTKSRPDLKASRPDLKAEANLRIASSPLRGLAEVEPRKVGFWEVGS